MSKSVRSPDGSNTMPKKSGSALEKSSLKQWNRVAFSQVILQRLESQTSAKRPLFGIAKLANQFPTRSSGRTREWLTTSANLRKLVDRIAFAQRLDCLSLPISVVYSCAGVLKTLKAFVNRPR